MLFGGPMRKIIKPQLETISYNLKESKESLQQSRKESPISLWFSYGKRQRLRYSIGISVGYDDWDFERQRVRRNRSLIINSAKVNSYLDKLQNGLVHHHSELVLEGKEVNNEVLRSILDRLTNRNIESEVKVVQDDFFVFADEFIEEKRGSIENVTLLLYKQSLKKLKLFSDSTTSIDFTSFTRPILNDFKRFLEVEQGFKLNTISKHFKSIKTIVLEGKRRGLIGDVDLRLFSIPTEEPTKIYLSESEIRKIKDLDLSNDKTMELARDIFLVGCYTGQRISDYNRLSGIDIVEKDGVHFFEILQKKSGVKVNCPITQELKEIIQILNVTRQELVDIIKEGVKLELNRQRSIGNPLNRLSITGEDTEYLTRNEVSKVLNVTVQTLNNWRREGVLNPIKIGGRVLYRKEDVYNNSRLVA